MAKKPAGKMPMKGAAKKAAPAKGDKKMAPPFMAKKKGK